MHVFYVILRYSTHKSMSKQLSYHQDNGLFLSDLAYFQNQVVESGLLHLLRRLGTGLFGNSSFNCIFEGFGNDGDDENNGSHLE
ncbi:hypothetical protein RIR_jg40969.t1 [Rhizophagus irregularis DAOM 181602=DAOM 197198]|nr:hypothetical protein RIR_jg27110.t1 [Rhizophagus irregularis DAOM 181602=DAOM 197198]GET58090.1 hypothetical protein RIR_jg10428.t1 [Rhizophagus irregularis DAOM 181602=DAOM 197198]GET65251.1 hypothetical protein RIR_jg40969.t1 [Rhizophagus irregularis DAOM 181602=DAOM 197198]